MVDTLPNSVDFILSTPSQGTCTEAGGIVTCSLGTITNGSTVTVEILVSPTKTGTIFNTAIVSSDTNDPNPDNNKVTISTTVLPGKK